MDPQDAALFNKFMPTSGADPLVQSISNDSAEDGRVTNLADLILEKIAAHEAAQAGKPIAFGGGMPEDAIELPARVVEVYSK